MPYVVLAGKEYYPTGGGDLCGVWQTSEEAISQAKTLVTQTYEVKPPQPGTTFAFISEAYGIIPGPRYSNDWVEVWRCEGNDLERVASGGYGMLHGEDYEVLWTDGAPG